MAFYPCNNKHYENLNIEILQQDDWSHTTASTQTVWTSPGDGWYVGNYSAYSYGRNLSKTTWVYGSEYSELLLYDKNGTLKKEVVPWESRSNPHDPIWISTGVSKEDYLVSRIQFAGGIVLHSQAAKMSGNTFIKISE